MEQNGIPDWGYVFYPASSPLASAHARIEVNICAVPTELHYDPERLTVPVVDHSGAIQQVTISHPWHGKHQLRLASGYIVVRDRKEKVVEAYTAGGQIDISVSSACTCCQITSPAPLYRLESESGAGPESAAAAVVDKIEALLAVRRARWGANDLGFEQRLTSIEPSDLYAAGLHSIQTQLDQVPAHLRGARYQTMARGVDAAILSAKESGQWPVQELVLEDLV